jgi:hypothetical protein
MLLELLGESAFFAHYGHFESSACFGFQSSRKVKGFIPQDSQESSVFPCVHLILVHVDAFATLFDHRICSSNSGNFYK